MGLHMVQIHPCMESCMEMEYPILGQPHIDFPIGLGDFPAKHVNAADPWNGRQKNTGKVGPN